MGRRQERLESLREDTWKRGQIAPRVEELINAASPHFPGVDEERLSIEAEDRDRLIRHNLRLSSVEIWRRVGRDNQYDLKFGHGLATPAALGRLEAAIAARDPWRFKKSWGAISFESREKIHYHIALRWHLRGGGPSPRSFGAAGPMATASLLFSPQDDAFWSVALEVIARRRRAATSRRRPQNILGDRIALELAMMWSSLTGRPLVVPRNKNGTSELGGPMIAFVRDAAKVYPEVTISFNSTASWSRILRLRLS